MQDAPGFLRSHASAVQPVLHPGQLAADRIQSFLPAGQAHHQVIPPEDLRRDLFQIADQRVLLFLKMLLRFLHGLVISNPVRIVLELGNGGRIGQRPQRRRRMSGGLETHLQPGFEHGKDFFQTLLILQLRLHQNLPHHPKQDIHLRIQRLALHLKGRTERLFFYISHIRIHFQRSPNAPGMHIDLVKQFAVFIAGGIDDPQHGLEHPHVGQLFLRHAGQVEHQCHISDAVGIDLMVYQRNPLHLFFFIKDGRDLPGDILPAQDRDLLPVLLCILALLIVLQCRRVCDQPFLLGIGEAVLIRLEPLFQLLVQTGRPAPLRLHSHDGAVGVVQKPLLDQLLKISGADLLL